MRELPVIGTTAPETQLPTLIVEAGKPAAGAFLEFLIEIRAA